MDFLGADILSKGYQEINGLYVSVIFTIFFWYHRFTRKRYAIPRRSINILKTCLTLKAAFKWICTGSSLILRLAIEATDRSSASNAYLFTDNSGRIPKRAVLFAPFNPD